MIQTDPNITMSTKSPHAPDSGSVPNDDEIRDYAYHLYDQSGQVAGRDLDNWLEARACLSSGVAKSDNHLRLHQNSYRRS